MSLVSDSAELITSLRNPRIKMLRSLRQRKYRYREGVYLIEGIRIVEEALVSGAIPETLVYAPDLLVSERAQTLVEQVPQERRLAVSKKVFGSLSHRDAPQGIAAVLPIDDQSLESVPLSPDLLVVVAYQVRDPGNLGSIIRTADAAGATAVVVVEPAVDLYDPQVVRATMGSLFGLPIIRLEDGVSLLAWIDSARDEGLSSLVVATSAHASQRHFDVDYCSPVVLFLGRERDGLPALVRDRADVQVRLPMAGRATSLNVSAAAAALIYEIVRQRTTSS